MMKSSSFLFGRLIASALLCGLLLVSCSKKKERGPIQHFQDKDASGKVWREYDGYLDRTLRPIPHGKIVYYYPGTTSKRIEGFMTDGHSTGLWREYTRDGKLNAEIPHKDGFPEGEAKIYYPSTGKLKAKGAFVRGLQHGIWEFYDETGKLTRKEFWEKGKLITEEKGTP